MITTGTLYKSGNQLSSRSITIWRIVQTLVWLVGFTIFLCLIFYPSIGILLFWNILIPVAPALLVVSTGLWRNVCPLATTFLLPRHFDISKRKKMSVKTQSKLQLAGILALYAIVPLRHALLNRSGLATAMLLTVAALAAVIMGLIFDWKSAWCASLCPVSPVEKLYGGKTLISLPNAHCSECVNCSVPCPDSTPNFSPATSQKNGYQKLTAALTIGGLPGFIWGWFHVPDHTSGVDIYSLLQAYNMPLICFSATLILYEALGQMIKGKNKQLLISCFAAAGVSCYYWYRLPALFGFGKFADDGLLISLRNVLPAWSMTVTICATTVFFFWWLVFRRPNQQSWLVRPEFAEK